MEFDIFQSTVRCHLHILSLFTATVDYLLSCMCMRDFSRMQRWLKKCHVKDIHVFNLILTNFNINVIFSYFKRDFLLCWRTLKKCYSKIAISSTSYLEYIKVHAFFIINFVQNLRHPSLIRLI